MLRAKGPDCEAVTLTKVSHDGTRFGEGRQELFLHSGALQTVLLGIQYYGLHGHSPVSLLVKGHEWFFTREHCRARGPRFPPLAPPLEAVSQPGIEPIATALDRGSVWTLRGGQTVVFKPLQHGGSMGFTMDGTEYEVRFYLAQGLAWLNGPLNRHPAQKNARRRGLYRLALGKDYFEIGTQRFCLERGAAVANCSQRASDATWVAAVPGLGMESEIVDAAAEFWRYQGPFSVPLLAKSHVTCQTIDLHVRDHSYDPPIFRIESEGVRQTINARRLDEGFAVRLGTAFHPTVVGYAPNMVVHGRDEKSFLVNGSRWFLKRADCEASRTRVKPTNFGLSDKALTPAHGKPGKLHGEYFVPQAGTAPGTCARVSLTRLAWPMGILSIEHATGLVEYDYDFYPIADALWLGPAHEPEAQRVDRLSGRLLSVQRLLGGLRVGGTLWYETEASCLSALELPALAEGRSEAIP